MRFFGRSRRQNSEINPDEIFLDSSNLADMDTNQFEGRLEKPISRRTMFVTAIIFLVIGLLFMSRLWFLQVATGKTLAADTENNALHDSVVFADRGVIFDRNDVPLAWNVPNPSNSEFSLRKYATSTGLSDLIGYVKYPSKDTSGFYYQEDYVGQEGLEKYDNDVLEGKNGMKITETDVSGKPVSESAMNMPVNGQNITLSIDSRIQSQLYIIMDNLAGKVGFTGGAGVIMNVHTGEILAEVSYPGYSSQVMTDGSDISTIQQYLTGSGKDLLNRATNGLYTPGSIVKPVMALGALDTGVIAASTVIDTHGYISVPNPYDPAHPSIFKDWQNNGPLDMAKAIQESSDAYFYEVGGGYQDQKGMGIANIDKYASLFGYGTPVGGIFGTVDGTVPSPAWKAANFNGEQWTIGDTYHTVIGQYGFQVTPLQVVRAIGAVANDGTLLTPTIIKGDTSNLSTVAHINLPQADFNVVHQGMRQSAEMGTAAALNVSYMQFAGKTGTAQIGLNNAYENSWVAGFWPFQNPQYAFAIVMEHAPAGTLFGSPYVGRQLFDWMDKNTPEYFE